MGHRAAVDPKPTRRAHRPALATTAALVLGACGSDPVIVSALTYNVAGLPEGLSGSHPERNTPLISPLLEPYDLVLVQEDFTYHDALVSRVTHGHRSIPKVPETKLTGDGLNVLARLPFDQPLERTPWAVCNGGLEAGSDCLAEKGFAVATHHFSEDIAVDVYDLHLDAGGGEADLAAREAQVDQLLAAVATRSAGRAVIIAGDTNLRRNRPRDVAGLEKLLAGAGLTDSCAATSCGDDDHIDRFLFRSSEAVELVAESWSVDARFVDEMGEDLSDHPAIAVRFRATAR